eukprot:m.365485 g.365485  ORF g.365485 m.365485 type:complete len:291 (-) comp19973_c0_seq1:196-1068(-)
MAQPFDAAEFEAAHAQVVMEDGQQYVEGQYTEGQHAEGQYVEGQFVDQQGAQFADGQYTEGLETTPVHEAAALGDLETLYSYLQPEVLEQYDINGSDGYGRTALVYAILAEQVDCVELLIQAGAHIDGADADGRTPLHWTTFHGKSKMMKYLLSLGANPALKDFEGRTPLHLSTGSDSSKCTKQLLKKLPPELVDEPDNENMTALHWAAFHDHPKHLGQLLNAGANVALMDNEGKVALHWTANNPTESACHRLLESGVLPGWVHSMRCGSALSWGVFAHAFPCMQYGKVH